MREVVILKQGEIVLKGLNRQRFEEALLRDVKRKLEPFDGCSVYSAQSTVTVEPGKEEDIEGVFAAMQRVFGIVAVMRAAVCPKDMDAILDTAETYLEGHLRPGTFKVIARRSDKRFPASSPEICALVGERLINTFPGLTAKMDDWEQTVRVEIRDRYAFIGCKTVKGAGGLPMGTAGRAALLLSGGIDSPVAGFMMAKRGLFPIFIHFHSYPYTSEEAKQKVLSLSRILCGYTGRTAFFCVSFTKIQQEMLKTVDEDYFTIIMRRMMMRIADRIAEAQNCPALITGESLAQVASQTLEAMAVTEKVVTRPIFKPLIGMDKEEIVTVARRIGTFETSSLPYEDCCTVFTPRHPQTKPHLDSVLEQEKGLSVESLVNEAVETAEKIIVENEG